MKKWCSIAPTIAMTMVFATTASAISLDFISVPGGGNIGPYQLAITGDVAIAGPPALNALPNGLILGVCNDVAGTVSGFGPGSPWEVQKHALFTGGAVNSGSLEFGAVGTGVQASTHAKFFGSNPPEFRDANLRDYKIGAYLANNVLTNTQRVDSQHALWAYFNLNHAATRPLAQQISIGLLIAAAEAAVDSGTWHVWKTFAVYTKVPLGTAPPGGIQEFYVKVPEAASFASLGLYIGGLGLLGYAFRRRMKLSD